MENIEEKKESLNNFCRSCKKYYRKYVGGNCPVCGAKLSTYRPPRYYMKDDTRDERKEQGKVINFVERFEKSDANFRMISRQIESLELRYKQIIQLFSMMMKFSKHSKTRVTMAKLIKFIEKVVDEPDEVEVDLVDEAVNWKEIK